MQIPPDETEKQIIVYVMSKPILKPLTIPSAMTLAVEIAEFYYPKKGTTFKFREATYKDAAGRPVFAMVLQVYCEAGFWRDTSIYVQEEFV